ncbi:MAG: nucleotidyltransferase domain-containing protein [Actinomycetes bacterium]
MRTAPNPLLPILRSRLQGDLLALLYLHPNQEYTLTDIARLSDASVKAVHQEVNRLVTTGFLADRRRGNLRLVRAVTDAAMSEPLTDLLATTYGPLPILRDLLTPMDGVERAYIYGSWASRYQGNKGELPNDVDVLVVGQVDPDLLYEMGKIAAEELGLPVNIHCVSVSEWDQPGNSNGFIRTLQQSPVVALLPMPQRQTPVSDL